MRVIHLLPALASAALLLSGTAALAQQAAPASTTAEESGGTPPAPAAKPKKERKICKRDQTGTRLARPDCRTAAEWAALDAAARGNGMDPHQAQNSQQ